LRISKVYVKFHYNNKNKINKKTLKIIINKNLMGGINGNKLGCKVAG